VNSAFSSGRRLNWKGLVLLSSLLQYRLGCSTTMWKVPSGHISVSTMHLVKSLEFLAVVLMACDDEVLPLQERIEMGRR
jgi:superfamily I DNA/RNA helicase